MTDRIVLDGLSLEIAVWHGNEAKTPFLLVHEGLGSVAMWRAFPARLRATTGCTVYAYSRQGHGWSDPLSSHHEPDYMHREGEDVLPRVLDVLELPIVHLFGHSDGASIALIAAATQPARVACLVLEAPHVFVEDRTIKSINEIKSAFTETEFRSRLARYHRDVDHTFSCWSAIWLDLRFRKWNIEGYLAKIQCPALLIQGKEDQYGTADQIISIESRLPVSERLILDDCGHAPHMDQGDRVLKTVESFLSRHVC